MCLSCQYGYYSECKKCESGMCKHDNYILPFCDDCFKVMQKKRKCRTCEVIFESGNALFRHLKEKKEHVSEHKLEHKSEHKKKIFSSRREEYADLCDSS